MIPSKREDKRPLPEEVLKMLADKILDRLKSERRIAELEWIEKGLTEKEKTIARRRLFFKVSEEIFEEEEVEKDYRPEAKKQIGSILNKRKPKPPIDGPTKKMMMSGAKELEKENRERGIDEHGNSTMEVTPEQKLWPSSPKTVPDKPPKEKE